MADRNSYTDKTVAKWSHGRDDMVFNREFWIAIGAYLLAIFIVCVFALLGMA